jgi:hypothetical protein
VITTAIVLLGVIALATLVMASIQVGLVIVAARLGRQIQELGTKLEQDIRPLVANATAVTANAARVSELAVTQVERADRIFADVTQRIDDTSRVIQGAMLAPAREGRALLAAIGAALGAVREARNSRTRAFGVDDDDPLFIG